MSTAVARATLVALVLVALASTTTMSVRADARSDYLIRLLESSSQFRVRAQAAISLGRVTGDDSIVQSLSSALDDEHPAVRAAAASSLERLGNPAALPALKKRVNDNREEVRSAVQSAVSTLERARVGPARGAVAAAVVEPAATDPVPTNAGQATFYVGVGMPGSRVAGLDETTLTAAREFLRARVQALNGVVVAPSEENTRQAEAVIRARKLTGYFIDSSIVSIEQRSDGGVRASVSVIVGTYPGRDMRSILQGAATVMGGGSGARNQAIEAAFTGALRNLGQAMAAGRR